MIPAISSISFPIFLYSSKSTFVDFIKGKFKFKSFANSVIIWISLFKFLAGANDSVYVLSLMIGADHSNILELPKLTDNISIASLIVIPTALANEIASAAAVVWTAVNS